MYRHDFGIKDFELRVDYRFNFPPTGIGTGDSVTLTGDFSYDGKPLKGLGKNAALGLGGALLLGVGGLFCSVSALRAMQTETDWFERHNLSYLPYFLTIVLLGVLAVIGWVGLGPGKKDR